MAVDPRWRPLAPSAATHSRSARAAVRRVQAFLMAWPSTSGQPFPARPALALSWYSVLLYLLRHERCGA